MKSRNLKAETRNRIALIAAMLVLFSLVWLAHGMPQAGGAGERGAATGPQMRFLPFDVYVESGANPLGAYQIEVNTKDAAIVGLEGGEPLPFRAAPFYDPEALQGGRIVVAAFSTGDNLPAGLTRVARLHLQVNVPAAGGVDILPGITTKLVVATDGQGRTIPAKVTLRAFAGDKP